MPSTVPEACASSYTRPQHDVAPAFGSAAEIDSVHWRAHELCLDINHCPRESATLITERDVDWKSHHLTTVLVLSYENFRVCTKRVSMSQARGTATKGESDMTKARDTRKDVKKKPAKSLMEKRAAKKEKKASKQFGG